MDVLIDRTHDDGLNLLVETTGIAKAAHVRRALAEYLARAGVLTTETPGDVPLIPTTGPGLSKNRHRKERA
ncbi:MAG: hypothetical protein BGO95_11690 [Micrococcales bacterium 73-13]|nr:MAG: hypothetical protein BGO95_11690 [Micrococcales bacterium 73-13]